MMIKFTKVPVFQTTEMTLISPLINSSLFKLNKHLWSHVLNISALITTMEQLHAIYFKQICIK